MPVRPVTQDDLDRLACPLCHQRLSLQSEPVCVRCEGCHRIYPVRDELPVLLAACAL